MSSILKGGRLSARRRDVVEFISSIKTDERIALSTVLVNEAHVVALERCRAITQPAARKMLTALAQFEKHRSYRGAEDVHVLVEDFVTRRVGQRIGGLLHLGKSRNDQVAAAIRLTLREEILDLAKLLLSFELTLAGFAEEHVDTVFPGYTHLQPAQPISFGHYLIANCFALLRDSERINEAYARINVSPMGAAALAGTSFPLDRLLVARLLGFDGIVEASLDAVGSRDFALEALGVFALIAADLSRMASDLLFYTTAEAGLVDIPDEFASTSSIMPQKKNADPLELVRAKCAKITLNFSSAIAIMHGLTSGYNLDYQEITPILWESLDELKACLGILSILVPKLKFNKEVARMRYLEFTTATEVANLIVREEGLPFRTAHRRVGLLVQTTLRDGKTLSQMRRAEWEKALGLQISEEAFRRIIRTLDLDGHIRVYQTAGSPNPRETRRLVTLATRQSRKLGKTIKERRMKLVKSSRLLRRMTGLV